MLIYLSIRGHAFYFSSLDIIYIPVINTILLIMTETASVPVMFKVVSFITGVQMKNITKKVITSAISAVISMTAVAAFTAPATPVFAAGRSYSYNCNYDMQRYDQLQQEGIRFLENCVTDPSPEAQTLIRSYTGVIESHPYDVSKSYEQNANALIRYVNNVYKNVQRVDNSAKLEAYKAAKLEYLTLLSNSEEDDVIVEYVAYAFTYITYGPNDSLEQLMSEIDDLTAIAERGING